MVRLVPADLRLLDAAVAGDDALARALGHAVVPGWVVFDGALAHTRAAVAADPGSVAWGTRLFVAGDPPELVGWGGFKGPPTGGEVEIGYAIAPAREGRRLATEAARAMVAAAFADPAVDRVTAHTLPEPGPSTRVLEKLGFRHEGTEREDDQDVWRFVLARR